MAGRVDQGGELNVPLYPRPIIYSASTVESIRDGTLAGVQPLVARVLVHRGNGPHDDPNVKSPQEYHALVAETVGALAQAGLRSAVYCDVGGSTEELAGLIQKQVVMRDGRATNPRVAAVGRDLLEGREASRTIRSFNTGKVDALVASRFWQFRSDARPDVLVIAANTLSKRVLDQVLGNFVTPDPKRPVLPVVEFLKIPRIGGVNGRATYSVLDVLGETRVGEHPIIGGYLGADSDAKVGIDLENIVHSDLGALFRELGGLPVRAVVRTGVNTEDMKPLPAKYVREDEFAATIPHVPAKTVSYWLKTRAQVSRTTRLVEEGDELNWVDFVDGAAAKAYFMEHPIPPVAKPNERHKTEIAKELAAQHGIDFGTVIRIIDDYADLLPTQTRLHPERTRPRQYYGWGSQFLIGVLVQARANELRKGHVHAADVAAKRSSDRSMYPVAEPGSVTLEAFVDASGVPRDSVQRALAKAGMLVTRTGEHGRKGYHVLSEHIPLADELVRRPSISPHVISLQAMAAWLKRSERGVYNKLDQFEPLKIHVGHFPPASFYPWAAFEEAARALGPPKDHTPSPPIIWSELPHDANITPEQEAYARAVQVALIGPERLGANATMTTETAVMYLQLRAEHTLDELLEACQRAGVKIAHKDGVPYLDEQGQRGMYEYIAKLRPAPPQWERLQAVVQDLHDVSFTSAEDIVLASSDTERDYFALAEGSLQAELYVSSTLKQALAQRFLTDRLSSGNAELNLTQVSLLTGKSPDEVREIAHDLPSQGGLYGGGVLDQLLRRLGVEATGAGARRQAGREARKVVEGRTARSAPHAQHQEVDTESSLSSRLHSGKPVDLLTIALITGESPEAVRKAIKAARTDLGPKFAFFLGRDAQGVETEQYDRSEVITAIEDQLLGALLDQLVIRLKVTREEIVAFMRSQEHRRNARGRYDAFAIEDATEHFLGNHK